MSSLVDIPEYIMRVQGWSLRVGPYLRMIVLLL